MLTCVPPRAAFAATATSPEAALGVERVLAADRQPRRELLRALLDLLALDDRAVGRGSVRIRMPLLLSRLRRVGEVALEEDPAGRPSP